MSVLVWAGVVALGGVGSVLRFWVDGRVSARTGRSFPYGTLVVNVTGATLLGVVTGLGLSSNAALLAGTATIGSYTTFSTWMFETQRLGEDRQVSGLAANLAVSLGAGILAAAVGRLLGGLL
jgi:CrcB protein